MQRLINEARELLVENPRMKVLAKIVPYLQQKPEWWDEVSKQLKIKTGPDWRLGDLSTSKAKQVLRALKKKGLPF
jgi:hypothetical protein